MKQKIRAVVYVYILPLSLILAAAAVCLFIAGAVPEYVYRITNLIVLLTSTGLNVAHAVSPMKNKDDIFKETGIKPINSKVYITVIIIALVIWIAGWIASIIMGRI